MRGVEATSSLVLRLVMSGGSSLLGGLRLLILVSPSVTHHIRDLGIGLHHSD